MTFAFVDVVESTKAFAEYGNAFVAALTELQERVARHTTAVGGAVVKTEGDGAFLAFGSAQAAIDALVGLQAELAQSQVGTVPRLRARAGAHTGDAVPVADDYVALAVNVAARVTSAATAGQVVVTAATQAELAAPVGVCVGDYDLKDVPDPIELWRVYGDEAPLRALRARRTNVRVPVTGFVGRDRELAELRDFVASHHLVTVLGPGGLGKTRLVSELLLHIAGGVGGGAWLVELASLTAGNQIPAAIGEVVDVHTAELGAVAAELRRREEVLVVLDNCEHLIEAVADVVADLQESCPALRLVCTSREPLQIAGEHVWRLGPLTGEAARVELFTQRAQASGATVRDEPAGVVDRLCTALDGLPLAIELAATQCGSTTLDELIRIAEQGADGLTRRGGQRRQRSLDAVLMWSLDYLPPPQRASLLVLSILPGRFDLQMATTILEAVAACEAVAVRPLARASLIDLDGENYRLLDTIRHAARRLLAGDPDLGQAARLGLRAWARAEAAALFREQRRFDDVPLDRLLALETALEHAMDDGASGIGMLWELVRMISAFGEPSARVVALARRVMAWPLPADEDGALCFAAALDVLARSEWTLQESDARLEMIAAAADARGGSVPAAALHGTLVKHYSRRGDIAAAREHLDDYVRYAACPAADASDRRAVHHLRACVAQAAGELEEALAHIELDLQEARTSGIDMDLDLCEMNVAEVLLDLGRAQQALPHAAESVRLARRPGPARRFALLQLARAQSQLGNTEAAMANAREIETELCRVGRLPERVHAELEQLRHYFPALIGVPGTYQASDAAWAETHMPPVGR